MTIVLPSSAIDSGTPIDLVGGKACGLAALTAHGVAVPEFVVISTDAYRTFMDHPDAIVAVARFEGRLRAGVSRYTLAALAEELTESLRSVPVPVSIIDAVTVATEPMLAVSGVAVRSSATSEDGIEASGAGLHHSSLNALSIEDVLIALHSCWRSLWSAPAIQNRLTHNVHRADMAVIIQAQIDPVIAGVTFSTDPVHPAKGAALEAVTGTGAALVGGETTPETWQKTPVGGLQRLHNLQILTRANAMKLFEQAEAIARQEGQPVDLEWAIDKRDALWTLQMRPITTLSVESRVHSTTPPGRWTRSGFGEWFQRPLSPLFASLVLPRFEAHTDVILSEQLGVTRQPPTFEVVNHYLYSRVGVVTSWRLIGAPRKFLRSFSRGIGSWNDAESAHDAALAQASDEPELIARITALVEANAEAWAWIVLTGAFAKVAVVQFEVVHGLMGIVEPKSSDFLGGHDNTSVDADDSLWLLARGVAAEESRTQWRPDDLSSPNTKGLLAAWIRTHGHRALDLDPVYDVYDRHLEQATSLVLTHLNHPTARPKLKQRESEERRRQAHHWAAAHFSTRPVRRRLFARSLTIADRWSAIRERRPNALHRGWPPLREAIDEAATDLVATSVIERPDDVYFLTNTELIGAVGDSKANALTAKVSERRRAWLAASFQRPADDLNVTRIEQALRRSAARFGNIPNTSGPTLSGRAASGGRASGTARVVVDPVDWWLVQPGDILVTKLTTPAWTGLLAIAGAVVTEEGGALSHAAIIAREYNIPAVVGVGPDLPALVSSGDHLIVDGDRGTVTSLGSLKQS